jgi:hypothetical protein
MANNVPVFEFGKDSYILKHKLNYKTTSENEWSDITYGILFTDYDLARKTQSSNAENFSSVIINDSIEDIGAFRITHYDEEWTIGLYNRWIYSDIVSGGTSFNSGATFLSDREYQAYYLPSGYTFLFQVGDYVNVYFHGVSGITGHTNWEHFGPSGETWVATGVTTNQIPWQTTGVTYQDGYSSGVTSGITDWYVVDFNPILKYRAQIIEVGTNYLKIERKLEDYIYNNIMKIAEDTNYDYLFYTIESLDFADRSYYGIKYIFEETKWANYFSLTATTNQLIIQPIPNKEDLYFDYDNVEFITYYTGGTQTTYKFTTNNLYTKYKLDIFLDQLGYPSGTTVFYPYSAATYSSGYTGTLEFDIVLINSGDSANFRENTFIYATGTTSTNHICLLKKISGDTLTIISPRISMSIGEQIISINNMSSIYDISRMLYECYINIENGITTTFYDADLYDPNIFGPNVIDPNILGPWAFDPRSMNVIGTSITITTSGLVCSGSNIYDLYVIGIDSGTTSWYVTGNTELFTAFPSSGTTNMTVTITTPLFLGSGNIEFRWANNGLLVYSYPINVVNTC